MSLNGRECLPGYRLKRVEILNWGTFNGAIHRLIPDARWSLLIGDNGSGKSTSADALRTLLVPPSKLAYNDASIDHKLKQVRKDRTRQSYIRGAFGAVSQENSSVPVVQHHRDEGVLSMLLAVFTNEISQANVTLAQILWVQNNKPDQLYLIAREDKNIKDHLANTSPGREMRKELKREGFETFDSFTAYEERFRQLLGIPGSGALEVFNQVIGVKEVTDLNAFIRKHMLEPTNTREYIETHIKPHYTQLNACWEAIKRAQDQLLMLNPICDKYGKWGEAKVAYGALERVQDDLPHYYNQRQLELRFAYHEELEEQIAQIKRGQETLQKEQETKEQERDSLNAAISSDATGQRLKDIAREVQAAQDELNRRMRAQESLKQQMALLQQAFPLETEAQFKAMRQKLLTDKGPLEGNLEAQDKKKMEHYTARENATTVRESLGREAKAIRDSGALIPHRLHEVRRQVCQATGVPQQDLPFTGELIEVDPQFKEWTGAIERLLHGFGTSLLVGERHYHQVAEFINSHFLGTRLVFHQVPSAFTPARPEILTDQHRIPARLRFQDENPFCKWLQAEVARRFSHPCCDRVEQLRELSFGITKEGLIKDGTRHVKDDNFRVGDRTQYVLGWSIQSKLAALQEEVEKLTQQANDHDKKYKQAVANLQGFTVKLAAIKVILAIEDFSDLDYRPLQERMAKLHDEQDRLKKASSKVTELQRQLDEVTGELTDLREKLQTKTKALGKLEGHREDNTQRVNALKRELEAVGTDFELLQPQVLKLQAEKNLTLENIETVRRAVEQRIREGFDVLQKEIDVAQRFLLPAMQRFMTTYPQERATLQADIEYGPEFVKLRDEIKSEELPKYQERFFSLLNTKLIMDMAAFNMKLVQDEKDIRETIDLVNRTLRQTRFSKDTYVHVRITPTTSDEIHRFRAKLKACLARGILPGPKELDQIYENIREMISEFEKEPEWTIRVTDVRNWMDYGVQELSEVDGAEVQYYAMSSGKSGGQKTILAFNIMASAITSQYGLTGNGDDINRFRLVLVDEAFAKTDPANSQRTLDLFKALGLQLLIINPWDAKSRIVEDYVDTYHLANTDTESHLSSLTRATRERYLEVRKARDAGKASSESNAHAH